MTDVSIKKSNNWLSRLAEDKSRENVTSQRGEDRILREIFKIIGTTTRWAVEFGAADGRRGSNTWQFITREGWSAVEIEPRRDIHLAVNEKRDTFNSLSAEYQKYPNVVCLNTHVEYFGERRLDAILAQTKTPNVIDLLSVDIDGDEYRIWDSLKDYSARVVIVEHNKTIPIELDITSDKGSSLRALVRLGKEKGYELVAATFVNAIFVKKEDFPKFGIRNNDSAEIWQGHENYRNYVYQLTDGTVVLQGNNKLRWTHGFNGTIDGQIRNGSYVWLRSGANKLFGDFKSLVLTAKPTGVARAIIHRIASRV